MNLIERMEATQRTVDAFKGRVLDFGKVDCVQMALAHSRHVGRKVKVPAYGDPISGRRALRQAGFETLAEALDRYYTRIKPHEAMLGDFIEMPGSDTFSALAINVGNGRVLGFHEDIPHADILQPLIVFGAWSVG